MPGYILKAQEKLLEDDPIVSDDEDFDTDDDGDDYDDIEESDDEEEDDPHERAMKERLANVQKKMVEIHAGMKIIHDEIKKMRYDMEMCFQLILLLIKDYVTKNIGIDNTKDLAQPTVDSVASQLDYASSSPALPPTMAANAAIRTSEYSQIVAADAPMPDAAA